MDDSFFSFEKDPILKYKKLDSDKVFIGCFIKSKYDEDRILIKQNLNPERIIHNEKCLYGCLFDLKKNHTEAFNILEKFKGIDLFFYEKTLRKSNLSCEENFSYLNYGSYPVDSKYISEYIPNFNYENFFENNLEVPLYQKIKSVNMLFLSSKID
jgi:hypothetical protein